jgi:alkyldihydroxyacetonephosphate synthase
VVVSPPDTEGVALLVAWAAANDLTVRLRGGGSNVVGAGQAPANVILSTENLVDVVEFDEISQVITVGAGTEGGRLEAHLASLGFTLGHYPQSLNLSTVGGWIAMRATGTYSAYFGGIEHLLCGATVVLASGDVVRIAPRPRASGGLDALSLLCGSEGSFGVVTEASLRVSRIFDESRTCVAVRDFAAGLNLARDIAQSGLPLGLVRLSNAAESQALNSSLLDHGRECLLIVTALGPRSVVDAAQTEINQLATAAGARLLDVSAGDMWFASRYADADLMASRNAQPGTMFDTFEVALPWRTVVDAAIALERMAREVSEPFYLHASHVYPTGTCLYGLLHLSESDDGAVIKRWRVIWAQVLDIVACHGGTLSHHHGIGAVRAGRYRQTPEGRLHQLIAGALDKSGVLATSLIDNDRRRNGIVREMPSVPLRGEC